ncbi:MAG: hypothetical protein D6772_09870, partial [Bacteroidetes bacterium]
MTTDKREALARKRVKAKKDFYKHLATYCVLGGFFFVLNVLTSPGRWWFYWPMLGWGIGVATHYLNTFGFPGSGAGSSEWEEKELAKERARLGMSATTKRSSQTDTVDID